jgi:hypothetical protein
MRVSSNNRKRQMKWVQPTETIRNSKNNQRDTTQSETLKKTKEAVLVWGKIIETIMKTKGGKNCLQK